MKIPSMDGETSSMNESAVHGCYPWMEKYHPWMSSLDGEMSSLDESVIVQWMEMMDDEHGLSISLFTLFPTHFTIYISHTAMKVRS